MTYAERCQLARHQASLETLADPSSSPEDIYRAERYLLSREPDLSRLVVGEQDLLLHLLERSRDKEAPNSPAGLLAYAKKLIAHLREVEAAYRVLADEPINFLTSGDDHG